MDGKVADLLARLDVSPVGNDVFVGDTGTASPLPLFGGLVAAQSVVAAGRTVPDKRIHSLAGEFLLHGRRGVPTQLEVERTRDGRSFATRRVLARQDDRVIFHLQCSFHNDESSLDHQDAMPPVADPDELVPIEEAAHDHPDFEELWYLLEDGIEIRYAAGAPFGRTEAFRGHQQLWIRTGVLSDTEALLQAGLVTYIADFAPVDTMLQNEGYRPWDPALMVHTLDHHVWFHRPPRLDGWVLYDLESPTVFEGRGFARGTMFDRRGSLIASVAQEGLVRLRSKR